MDEDSFRRNFEITDTVHFGYNTHLSAAEKVIKLGLFASEYLITNW